jgi:hypothetical protein
MKKLMCMFLLFIIVIPLQSAEKWVFVSGDNKTNIYYAENTVVYNETFNCFTVYMKYKDIVPDTLSSGKVTSAQYLSYIIYCTSRQALLIEMKETFLDGTYEYLTPVQNKNTIVPGSAVEKVFNILCK